MKRCILYLSVTCMAGLAFVNLYNSLVDTTSWISDVPHSVAAFRAYYHAVNPGNFFRIFSPVNQVLALVSAILYWKAGGKVRNLLLAAFILAVSADVLTFSYFYPRNDLLIHLPLAGNADRLTGILRQWRGMNWVRTAIVLGGLVCLFSAVTALATRPIREKRDNAHRYTGVHPATGASREV